MQIPGDIKVTTEILWKGAFRFAMIDILFITVLRRLIKPEEFRKMKWRLAIIIDYSTFVRNTFFFNWASVLAARLSYAMECHNEFLYSGRIMGNSKPPSCHKPRNTGKTADVTGLRPICSHCDCSI